MEKAQTESSFSISSDEINVELSKEFLEELQTYAYHEWIDEDVINHIVVKEQHQKGVKEIISAQQYVLLPLWSTGSQDPQNTDDDVAFDVKENENDVHVSANGSDKTDNKKHDAKVNDVSAPVNVAEPNSNNSTNSFNTASPFVNVVSLNFKIARKSLFVDPSKHPNDLDMPELEDIVYLDDEEDVGVDADLSNLEINISISHILTTRVYKEEPKKVHQALKDPSLIKAMQEELLQFKMQKGHTQEEGINYDEVFALVARIEAIWLFLAYASFMGFMVYQMNVKSTFLYGTIEEEVYVFQPLVFKDPDYPDKVYKVVKALYGLHQDPRAWYKTLANYLLENSFQREKIDQTLFIKKQKEDILLVQVYVNDIIFGSTNKELCKAFDRLMKDKFQMSSMGELTFFLGLQTVVATSSTEAEWVVAASCFAQVLWIQNQLLDYGKKVVVSDDVIRRDLLLDDADGVECLPNKEIFKELARMGYEKPPLKVVELEQDKHTQALEILQLKKRVKKLEKKKKSKHSGFNRLRKVVAMDVEPLGRINQEDVNAVSKGVSAVEPNVFDDEEVTMTMAQILVKLKVEKAKLLDEQIAQRLHDKEIQKVTARDNQEKANLQRAIELQK
nr:hypothetical protein [Tanacetum cinerariifolium]